MADAELIRVLTQIRDELREMNGKNAEGERKPTTWPVYPYQWYPYQAVPYTYPYYWTNTVDHQGESPVE